MKRSMAVAIQVALDQSDKGLSRAFAESWGPPKYHVVTPDVSGTKWTLYKGAKPGRGKSIKTFSKPDDAKMYAIKTFNLQPGHVQVWLHAGNGIYTPVNAKTIKKTRLTKVSEKPERKKFLHFGFGR